MISMLLDTYRYHEHHEDRKPKNPRNTKPQSPEAATLGENQEAEAGGKAGRPVKSREGVRIVSLGFPSKLARQLHLLASVEGVSIASIVTGAVGRAVAKRLPNALAEIAKADESPERE